MCRDICRASWHAMAVVRVRNRLLSGIVSMKPTAVQESIRKANFVQYDQSYPHPSNTTVR